MGKGGIPLKKHFRIPLLLALCLLVSALAAGTAGAASNIQLDQKNVTHDLPSYKDTYTFPLTALTTNPPLWWSIEDKYGPGTAELIPAAPAKNTSTVNVKVTGACHFHVVAHVQNGNLLCEVTVRAPIYDATISKSSMTMWVGNTESLSISPVPDSAYCTNTGRTIQLYTGSSLSNINWESKNTSVATVSPASGNQVTVTAEAQGNTTIEANVNGKTVTCEVIVHSKATDLKVGKDVADSKNSATDKVVQLVYGGTVALHAYADFDDNRKDVLITDHQHLFWRSSSSLVTVDADGNCEVVGYPSGDNPETVTITAQYTGDTWLSDSYKIIVQYAPITGLDMKPSPYHYQLLEGYSATPTSLTVSPPPRLEVKPIPDTANPHVTWSGGGTAIDVDPGSGMLTAKDVAASTSVDIIATSKADPNVTASYKATAVPLVLETGGNKLTAGAAGSSIDNPLIIRKGNGDTFTISVAVDPEVAELGPVAGIDEVEWYKGSTRIGKGSTIAITQSHFTDADGENGLTFYAKSGSISVPFYVAAQTVHVSDITLNDFALDQRTTKKLALDPASGKAYLTVTPGNATDMRIDWKYKPEGIIEVKPDANGVYVARITDPKKTDTVLLTAVSHSDPLVYDTCTVTITNNDITPGQLQLDRNELELAKAGDTHELNAFFLPADVTDQRVIWTSSDDRVVRVDGTVDDNSTLKVTLVAVAPGEATITATAMADGADGKPIAPATCEVTVSGIQISHKDEDGKVVYGNVTINVGKDLDLDIRPLGDAKDLSQEDWLWTSDNDCVRVNATTGVISGVSVGSAQVTCRNGPTKAFITVTVVNQDDKNIVRRTMTGDRYGLGGVLTGEKPSVVSFSQNICGATADYITGLSVDAGQGTLYYGYHSEADTGAGISNSDKFYASAHGSDKVIERITFVPRAGFTGVAVIPFECISKNGYPKSYPGEIHITVPAPKEISYTSENGEAVFFHSGDFSDYCKPLHGYEVASVRFPTPPSERYGYLYFDYPGGGVYASNVPASRRYYSSSEPALDSVAFVPREGYTGTFTIPYNGWDAAGNTFKGTIRITVRRSGVAGTGDVAYTAQCGQRKYFDAGDFTDLCKSTTGGTLSYVQFTELPDTEQAVLYAGTAVASPDAKYYLSAAPRLMDVNILPASDFTDTVTIPFTAADTAGKTFGGSVVVKVTKSGGAASEIYKTSTGMPVTFARSDFTTACKGVLPEALKSVRFHLPSESSGKLYEGFHDLHSNEPLASDRDLNAKALTNLVFVPKGGFSGSVYLSYTAADTKDNTCTGTVRVAVWPSDASEYFNDTKSTPWAVSSIDFLRRYGVVTGATETDYAPIQPMGRGDFILMLSRAYAMPEAGRASFGDVPADSYYAQALAAAKHEGIVSGDASGRFYPAQSVTRQDAALFLYRAMENAGVLTGGNAADLSRFPDGSDVALYAQEAMGALTSRGIFIGDSQGRLNPTSTLTRAEMAVILHRAIT